MIIDLHTHGKLTKKSDFSLDFFRRSVKEALDSGLTAIALTEHFNTRHFTDMYAQLDQAFEYKDDYYDADGLKIFPGMEVDASPSGHFLMVGPKETVLRLSRLLERHTEKGSFLPLPELLNLTDRLPLLRIGAHPMRESNALTGYDPSVLRRLDALDLNAKDLYTYGPAMEERVRSLAAALGLPVTGGSDAHQHLQLGSIRNRLEQACRTVEELRQCILQGGSSIEISPCLRLRVEAASTIKQLLKQQLKEKRDGMAS